MLSALLQIRLRSPARSREVHFGYSPKKFTVYFNAQFELATASCSSTCDDLRRPSSAPRPSTLSSAALGPSTAISMPPLFTDAEQNRVASVFAMFFERCTPGAAITTKRCGCPQNCYIDGDHVLAALRALHDIQDCPLIEKLNKFPKAKRNVAEILRGRGMLRRRHAGVSGVRQPEGRSSATDAGTSRSTAAAAAAPRSSAQPQQLPPQPPPPPQQQPPQPQQLQGAAPPAAAALPRRRRRRAAARRAAAHRAAARRAAGRRAGARHVAGRARARRAAARHAGGRRVQRADLFGR